MLALGCGIALVPAWAADPIFVPGPASGYVAPGNAPPQTTVNSAGLAAGTRQMPGTEKRTVNWNTTSDTTVTLSPGTFADTFGTMISDTGVTVGHGVSGLITKPLRWETNGDLTELGTLTPKTDNSIEAKANAVNAAGLAVGYSQVYDAQNTLLGTRALRWAAGATAPLQLPVASSNDGYSVAQARVISDTGLIAGDGQVYNGTTPVGQRGIRWSADYQSAAILETISTDAAGSGFAEVKAVNNAGTVAGNARKYSGSTNLGLRAVRWEAGSSTPVELGILGSTAAGANVDTTAIAMDQAGNIAGLSQKYVDGATKGTRPVVWKAGTTVPVELGISGVDPNGTTRGNMSAMNKYGFIAGTIQTFTPVGGTIGRRAIIWGLNGEMYNLNDMLPPNSGWILTVATDISDSGWVAGYGTFDPDNEGPLPAYDRYFSMQSDLFIATPEIQVSVDAQVLTDDVSTVALGNAAVGFTTVEKTITIRNAGTGPLNLTGVSVDGENRTDFTLDTTTLVTPLAANASTTFKVTFNPSALGSRTASLKVLSNDLDTASFDVSLSGTGVAPSPGVIAFQNAEISVTEKTLTVNVPVTRTGGDNGAVSVRVNSTPGTATQADFSAVTNYLVSFPAGDAGNKSVPVTLVADGIVEPEETFTLTLSDPQGGATLGGTQVITVKILATDVQKPVVTLTSPTANQVINFVPGTPVTITGSASDNVGIDKVQVSLNGGTYADAALVSGAPSATAWTYDATPAGGMNRITVRALDDEGNESLVERSFTYRKLSTLTVNTEGSGKVTGVLNGQVYEVGKKYTLTAAPGAGQVFDGWEGAGLTAPANEVAKLSFTFTDALFENPVIEASFVALPFTATEIGGFNGLVTPKAGTALSNSTQGFLNLTLTAKGTFSGKLKIDGFTLSVSGLFTNDGEARFGTARASTLLVERANKPSLELADVRWEPATDKISGVVNQYLRRTRTAQSDFVLDRAAFSAKSPVTPATYTANGGKYTVILPAKEQTNGLLKTDYPQGTGFGLITITPAGVVSFAGTLADNTAITASVPLSADRRAPLYAQLYATKGSYSAAVVLDNVLDLDSDLKAVNAIWFRPFQNKVQHYPWGWEEGVVHDLVGAKFTAGNNLVPGLSEASPEGNATLTFRDGHLVEDLIQSLNISAANAVTQLTSGSGIPSPYTLTLTSGTGDIKGSFTHSDGTKPAFKGKVYQKGAFMGAHGFFLTTPPKPVDGTGESGAVLLRKKTQG